MDLTNKNLWDAADQKQCDMEEIIKPPRSFVQDVWTRFWNNRAAFAGLVIILALILFAALGPGLSPHTYSDQNLSFVNIPPGFKAYEAEERYFYITQNLKLIEVDKSGSLLSSIKSDREDFSNKIILYDIEGVKIGIDYKSQPPVLVDQNGQEIKSKKFMLNKTYKLGTDSLGRDLLTRLMYGARISLVVAFIAAAVNLAIGVIYGSISGYLGGTVDLVMMRIVDVINTIPLTLYVILIMVFLNSGFLSIIIALGSVYWVNMARVVRGQILALKEQEFVLAAHTIGTSTRAIIFRHLIPNSLGPIIVTATMLIPTAIFVEAFMSFIGLGVAAPMASWGTMCNDALEAFRISPYQLFIPAFAICFTMFAFNFVGDGLRDALDIKLR